MLQPGTILLEKYRVERVLGKGGMGVVVAARHIHLGGLFAIKMLLPESQRQPEALERFLREARASAKLKGDHVAQVHDIGKLPDGTPYMLMEYLEGEDLGHFLERRGVLPVEEAALYVHQACEAVAKAHANGIVHRDLKPSNLFLTHQSNGFPCVKVLDFGIVRELDPANHTEKRLTKTGTFLGSPIYMPPEQMVDLKLTDTRGDVWALGLILYEFVTGIAPFESESVTSVVSKVLLTHPDPPSHLNPAIPSEFDAVVMRCLEKQPERRYPTARELMVDLEPFLPPAQWRGSMTWEASGPISRSIMALRAPLEETVPDQAASSATALAQTMAAPAVTAPPAMAETISANLSIDASTSNITPTPAEVPREDDRGAPKANDRRPKLYWIAGAAACVVAAAVAFVSVNATSSDPSAAAPSSVAASEAPPIASESSKPEIAKTTSSEPSALAKNSDVKAAPQQPSTNTAINTTKPRPTSTSPRVTKKTRVPRYDD